ncbi:ubiquitin protein ligase [Loa loa]|uniref:HECT-type E3 ubiquitin transferase n=1 Tax=Loa loa TaxID=7209 RepID=A0A1S0UL51_LOALO|nr:ubiquitin protein ligase [Loa loa]EJD76452.1 ubiquitin protein ligase [Loa loa]
MAGNLNLYDFNGSVRRNKLQEAIFSDLAKKEDFMRKINEERIERQERSRRKVAAIKIQSAYRGYRVRKEFHIFLRSLFDEAGPTQSVILLETQISRLGFFFRSAVDCERTLTLCSEAVALAQAVKANDLLDRRRRQQLLRCVVVLFEHTDRTKSYTSALRFLEIYIKEEDCLTLLNYGFYSSMMTLFSSCHQLPSPLYIEEKLPQRSESLLQILVLPINRLSKKTDAIFELFGTICKPRYETVTVCCLAPFLARLCKAGTLKFADIMDALSTDGYRLSSQDATSTLLTSYAVVVITSAFSLETLNDSEKAKLVSVFAALTQNITPPPEAMLTERSNNDDSDVEDESNDAIMAATSDVEPDILGRITSLCTLTYFIRIHSSANYISLTNLFSSFRQLIPSLWRLIMSLNRSTMFGGTQPLITILERGENISHSDEQALIPALSIFITLVTNALKTVDDDDFQNGGVGDTVFPLTLNQITDVVLHCRDLTLGLIDLAFPVNSGPFQQSFVKSSKWSDLFQDVALLTKALHERDNRVCVMPHNFWSSHNRNVVVNSSMWQNGRGRRRRARRPFEFVRFLLDNRDSDVNEDPPSVSELRNLSIVRSIPFVIPFIQRTEIFTELLLRDRIRNDSGRNGHFIAVHRATLYEDAFRALQPHNVPDMKSTIRVQMVNWAGLEEAGVDGGGIFREFLYELLQTALDPSRGFFAATHEQLLYPNPLAPFLYPTNFVDHFYFIGRIIAKLVYEGLLADIRFADFFLLQWMGNPGTVLDLELVKSYDPLLHKNLKFLKRCSLEEIETLDLDFTVITDNFGVTEKIELKKDGSCIKVTADNRMEYIQLYVNYYLSKRLSPMIAALRSGLRNVIDLEWLRMFSPLEISMLVGGSDSEIDFNELKKFTAVHNIKSENDQQYMDLFWSVINGFSAGDKKKLLKFITGCPRPPIMGFKTLTPPMGIQLVHDVDKLPTAATCMNLLKLPLYDDVETLRRKLIYAVNCGAGFELS